MKTIAIRLSDIEAAMFAELRTNSAETRMILMLISASIHEQYARRKGAKHS